MLDSFRTENFYYIYIYVCVCVCVCVKYALFYLVKADMPLKQSSYMPVYWFFTHWPSG